MSGFEPLGLLLWYGDFDAARTGFAKVLDAHKRVLTRVQHGAASASGCASLAATPVAARMFAEWWRAKRVAGMLARCY
jgi:hypothetical protein